MIGPESQRRTVGARPRFISAKPMDFHRWAITAEPIEHIYWSAITNRSTGIWFCGACFIIAGGSVCLCVCVCVCVCVLAGGAAIARVAWLQFTAGFVSGSPRDGASLWPQISFLIIIIINWIDSNHQERQQEHQQLLKAGISVIGC